jgi:transposase
MTVYSYDLRQKIVEAYDQNKGSQRKLAAMFGVSLFFVQSLMKRRRETGDFRAKQPVRKGPKPRLADDGITALRTLIESAPDATLAELVTWLAEQHQVRTSVPVVSRTLAKLGLTRKKRSARQRA